MHLTFVRDLAIAIAWALVLGVAPLFVAEGASAFEPLLSVGFETLLPASAMPSMLLGLGALVALAFYGRPRSDP
jgi:hypothetical protein